MLHTGGLDRSMIAGQVPEHEVRVLYGRLAAHWNWSMPETYDADAATLLSDPDAALTCLRDLAANLDVDDGIG